VHWSESFLFGQGVTIEHTDVASAGAVTLDDFVGCNERQLVESRGLGLSGIRWLVYLYVGFCDLKWRRFHVFLDVPGGRVSEKSNSDLAHRLIESSGTAKVVVYVVKHGDRRERQCSQTAERKMVPGLSACDATMTRRTNLWAAGFMLLCVRGSRSWRECGGFGLNALGLRGPGSDARCTGARGSTIR
jgi:hypothetical protein